MNKLLVVTCLAACSGNSSTAPDVGGGDDAPTGDSSTPGDGATPLLPTLQFCRVADPNNISAAYTTMQTGANALVYACAQPCPDPASCTFGLPIQSARGGQIQGLAFVVDGMAGHFAFTPDGDDVVVTHGGSGGTGLYHEFDPALQSISTLKTVSLGWEHGANSILGGSGGGWITRKDATPSSFHALTARPAAAIRWVKDNFAVGKKLGTVGASFGTIATFGAHVWWGLEPIIDYQMLIGGPPIWDINIGCGRDHTSAGHCDVDVAPCTGNPLSSYGNDDPSCGPATNNCRVPTIMAQISTGSEFDDAVNYIGNTTACAPATTRDPSLDGSNLASTVESWTFHGRIDFVANEGAPQPPQSDQGMGLGHAMYVYTAIQSEKGWIDNDGHHHGDAWQKDPALVAATAPVVVAGMGH